MFSNPLKRLTRNVSVRLNLWYALIFTVSAGLVFALLYLLLSAAVERKDREVLTARLKEYGAIYRTGGPIALRSYIIRSQEAQKEKSFFVRVIDPFNEVPVLFVPQDWIAFDPKSLGTQAILRIPQNAERDLIFASAPLFDGSKLQVGRSTDN